MAKHTIDEEWRPVVGYEGFYEVSSTGLVRSSSARSGTYLGRMLKPYPTKKGYRYIKAVVKNKIRTMFVHRMVLSAFVGPPPIGHVCNHKNRITSDNRVHNLEWVTYAENSRHAMTVDGENHPAAKLTNADVLKIIALKNSGIATSSIAKTYGVSVSTIVKMASGLTWTSVTRKAVR